MRGEVAFRHFGDVRLECLLVGTCLLDVLLHIRIHSSRGRPKRPSERKLLPASQFSNANIVFF
jgi:hypothetical protein